MKTPENFPKFTPNDLRRSITPNCPLTTSTRCYLARPCRRITKCRSCKNLRRKFFIKEAKRFCITNNLLLHAVITWKRSNSECPWSTLRRSVRELYIGRTIRSEKYIRVAAIGEKTEAAHIHLLLNERGKRLLKNRAKRLTKNCRFHVKAVHNLTKLLGYLYDQNFILSSQMSSKPKGIRLISGSRGISYGFPTKWNSTTPFTYSDLSDLYTPLPALMRTSSEERHV